MRYLAVLALFSLVSCSGAHTASNQLPPTPFDAASQGRQTAAVSWRYAAVGASDAVGIGASVPCGVYTSTFAGCPGGTGYAPDLSRDDKSVLLAPSYLDDLGLSSAVLGPDIRTIINRYGSAWYDACRARILADTVPGDFIDSELPNIPANTNQVTIFAGGNDAMGLVNALGCGAAGTTPDPQTAQAAFVQQWIGAFSSDLSTLVRSVRAKAPTAKIAIANLPDLADIPMAWSRSAAQKSALTQFSVGFDQAINAMHDPAGSTVVIDLLCDPQSYLTANYSSDGFHPDDAGYAHLASSFYAQIAAIGSTTSPPPAPAQTDCTRIAATAAERAPRSIVRTGELLPNFDALAAQR